MAHQDNHQAMAARATKGEAASVTAYRASQSPVFMGNPRRALGGARC